MPKAPPPPPPPPQKNARSTYQVGLAFLAAHALLVPAVVVCVGLLWGSFRYPTTVLGGLIVPYYIYTMVMDKPHLETGAPWDNFRQNFVLFRYCRRCLNLRLVGNAALDRMEEQPAQGNERSAAAPSSSPPQYIFAVFPHGLNADFRVLADGLLPQVLPQTGSKVRTLAASVLFAIPIVRQVALWTGCVDASRAVARRNLRAGHSLYILPGGQQEQLRTAAGRERVYLQRRRGFVQLALEFGVPLVPVYVFGVNDYYRTSHWGLAARLWLVKRLGISLTLGYGLWGSPLCPRLVDTTMVFGPPLVVAKEEHPSPERVAQVQAQFVAALQTLFDEHKAALGYGDRTLEIL